MISIVKIVKNQRQIVACEQKKTHTQQSLVNLTLLVNSSDQISRQK